ncbi:S9 family peptidase [Ulvibacter antarcticus]|uniref:Dipeptidyl aminopeptidase/acylaminoacyl peptidase n=1 Tax=Ulvibacter antarcticus TaxID=442714 RepID=A0A3L9YKH4_9FLAO|nr:S9 family peptidase [Ulvibacter antarcticus]RMA58498.1 dipeptidyl aminopeptidase/acylaminoacyl peptidase [Ulvibacter antarcticus]
MKIYFTLLLAFIGCGLLQAQNVMTPELLWQVKKVSPMGISTDGQSLVYKVSSPNMAENKFDSKFYKMPLDGGAAIALESAAGLVADKNVSPNYGWQLLHKAVAIEKITGKDLYSDLPQSDAYVYTALDYRHWDSWNDGSYNHVFYKNMKTGEDTDIMPGEPFYTPQAPFGGDEDYIWSPDSNDIYYVSKKVAGTAYAISTNTDIYKYNLKDKTTVNVTADNKGYDTQPAFSKDGSLAWTQMQTDGYEADKNDIVVLRDGIKQNLTARWDGTVNGFTWADNNKDIYFTAPVDGTIQIFKVDYPGLTRKLPVVDQLSEGQFNITGIVGQTKNSLIVTRTDMNHASEIYSFDLKTKAFKQLTHVNDDLYKGLTLPKVEKRYVTTKDNKKMLVWVILPPNFDASKKYPTLMYAQGGPQSALSQFYSFRWNFQLMASQGYIVVAPNRRGMPGHGVEWNEAISGDWGGKAMQDYLDAIDDIAKEPYVDNDRLGAVGASFGGYSVFYLAGHHNGRFKSFISHDGVFDMRSMYGTTEELFFVNYDMGGAYWEKDNAKAQKAFNEFNPINFVDKWDTPILIVQGGKDYRVPIEQGLEAFQAAQLQGIKSKLLYLPGENHWVLQPQNALVWQRQFFDWLKETL